MPLRGSAVAVENRHCCENHDVEISDAVLGTKSGNQTDPENAASGRRDVRARKRRLFYVTCSRAEGNLAVVYSSVSTEPVRQEAIEREWLR